MKKGFTLIELLVTITIIGILAVGGIQVFTEQMKKARDSNRVKDMQSLNNGVIQYVLDNSSPPNVIASNTLPQRSTKFKIDLAKYLSNIDELHDKKDGEILCLRADKSLQECRYIYRNDTNRNVYSIHARLESKSNVCHAGEGCFGDEDGGLYSNAFEVGNDLEIVHSGPGILDVHIFK